MSENSLVVWGRKIYMGIGVRMESLSLMGILCVLHIAYFEYYFVYCHPWLGVGLL